MNKTDLKNKFLEYQLRTNSLISSVDNFICLLDRFEDNFAFMRNCFDDGHFTASTFVVNKNYTKILLMHHIKFNKWQQFWWHADGEINLYDVALRELTEESWIATENIFMIDEILDVDMQDIPENFNEPNHKHYDVRYLAIVNEDVKIIKSDTEVHDIKWFNLEEVISSEDAKFQSSMKQVLMTIKNLQNK